MTKLEWVTLKIGAVSAKSDTAPIFKVTLFKSNVFYYGCGVKKQQDWPGMLLLAFLFTP